MSQPQERIIIRPYSRFWRTHESWTWFFTKALITVLVIALAAYFIQGRYRIHYDAQLVKCLPDKTFYLIDRQATQVVRGGMYAFKSRGIPGFPDGTNMLKIAAAVPGDSIQVLANEQILVNSALVATGLSRADDLKRDKSDFMGAGRLGAGQAWFLGTAPESYDSRYFGAVKVTGEESQIVGRAYALF